MFGILDEQVTSNLLNRVVSKSWNKKKHKTSYFIFFLHRALQQIWI